ncbi:MAG: UDP-2,3-diacylglucosamine diphosphatase [Gemmatimonadales bacterium]
MPTEALVIVSDAHLGYAPPETEAALLAFLDLVPTLGDSLLVNGDLFEFWFAYKRVIPRDGFRVAAALGQLARRLPVAVVGGNHDRWGRGFWAEELGVRFAPDALDLTVGPRRVWALHGDTVSAASPSRVLHRLVRLRVTSAVYRLLHPDLGVPLVRWLAGRLGDHGIDGPALEREAAAQERWAAERLRADPSLGLLVMGHTHRPALVESAPGRQYLNPGAWFDGFRYAVATPTGAELRRFSPSAPLPHPPAAHP